MQEASNAHSKTADSDTVSTYQVSSVQLVTDKSKMQYTTQRVYSKRDLFETLTSVNIAHDHHNRITH